jgi:hypothetical protein
MSQAIILSMIDKTCQISKAVVRRRHDSSQQRQCCLAPAVRQSESSCDPPRCRPCVQPVTPDYGYLQSQPPMSWLEPFTCIPSRQCVVVALPSPAVVRRATRGNPGDITNNNRRCADRSQRNGSVTGAQETAPSQKDKSARNSDPKRSRRRHAELLYLMQARLKRRVRAAKFKAEPQAQPNRESLPPAGPIDSAPLMCLAFGGVVRGGKACKAFALQHGVVSVEQSSLAAVLMARRSQEITGRQYVTRINDSRDDDDLLKLSNDADIIASNQQHRAANSSSDAVWSTSWTPATILEPGECGFFQLQRLDRRKATIRPAPAPSRVCLADNSKPEVERKVGLVCKSYIADSAAVNPALLLAPFHFIARHYSASFLALVVSFVRFVGHSISWSGFSGQSIRRPTNSKSPVLGTPKSAPPQSYV